MIGRPTVQTRDSYNYSTIHSCALCPSRMKGPLNQNISVVYVLELLSLFIRQIERKRVFVQEESAVFFVKPEAIIFSHPANVEKSDRPNNLAIVFLRRSKQSDHPHVDWLWMLRSTDGYLNVCSQEHQCDR